MSLDVVDVSRDGDVAAKVPRRTRQAAHPGHDGQECSDHTMDYWPVCIGHGRYCDAQSARVPQVCES
ncbi:hypothetical protein ACQP1U_00430 [Actinomycetota bacterium]